MSHNGNTEFLEFWFEHFLAEGFTEEVAAKLAEEKMDETPTPWGQKMTKDLLHFRAEIAKEFAQENVHEKVGALKEALAWARWEREMERDNNTTHRVENWRNIKQPLTFDPLMLILQVQTKKGDNWN